MDYLALEIGKRKRWSWEAQKKGRTKHHSKSLKGIASSRSIIIPDECDFARHLQNHIMRHETPCFIDGGVEKTADWPRAKLIRPGIL